MSNSFNILPDFTPVLAAVAVVDTVVDAIRAVDIPAINTENAANLTAINSKTIQTMSLTAGGTIESNGATAAPDITQVSANVAANTWGDYVQHIGSMAGDSYIAGVTVQFDSSMTTNWVLILAKGPNASEVVKIRFNFRSLQVTQVGFNDPIFIGISQPILFENSSRLTLRCANSTGGGALHVGVQYARNF